MSAELSICKQQKKQFEDHAYIVSSCFPFYLTLMWFK